MTAVWAETRDMWDSVAAGVEHHSDWMLPPLRVRPMRLRRANVPVVITGLPGTGKSVLRDGLLGRSGGLDYRTEQSPDWERDRVLVRGQDIAARVGLLVVPGQDSNKRDRALASTSGGRNAPTGWIHVVSWGYHRLWRGDQDKGLAELAPPADATGNELTRNEFLHREIEDFQEICERIKRPAVQRRVQWLVIAVAKCDLFWDRLDQARDYYIPHVDSPPTGFHRVLGQLAAGDRLVPPRILVVPFSASPQSHQYTDALPLIPTQLDAKQARALRNGFYDVLREVL